MQLIGVHDSLLTGYFVDAVGHEIVLHCEPHQGSAHAAFRLVFSGAVAHWFPAPLLPAILSGVEEVPILELLTSEWLTIEAGFANCGWPGPWAASLEQAIAYTQSHGIRAFNISSSIGLSGWVLSEQLSRAPASGT